MRVGAVNKAGSLAVCRECTEGSPKLRSASLHNSDMRAVSASFAATVWEVRADVARDTGTLQAKPHGSIYRGQQGKTMRSKYVETWWMVDAWSEHGELTRNCPAVQVILFDPYPCSSGLIPLSVLLPPTHLSSGDDGNTTHLLLMGAVDAGCC